MMPNWHTHLNCIQSRLSNSLIIKRLVFGCFLQTTFVQGGIPNYLGDNCYIDNGAANPYKVIKADDADAYHFTFNGIVDGTPTVLALTPEATTENFTDGTTMLVNCPKYEAGNKNQLWELVREEDLVKDLRLKPLQKIPSTSRSRFMATSLTPTMTMKTTCGCSRTNLQRTQPPIA